MEYMRWEEFIPDYTVQKHKSDFNKHYGLSKLQGKGNKGLRKSIIFPATRLAFIYWDNRDIKRYIMKNDLNNYFRFSINCFMNQSVYNKETKEWEIDFEKSKANQLIIRKLTRNFKNRHFPKEYKLCFLYLGIINNPKKNNPLKIQQIMQIEPVYHAQYNEEYDYSIVSEWLFCNEQALDFQYDYGIRNNLQNIIEPLENQCSINNGHPIENADYIDGVDSRKLDKCKTLKTKKLSWIEFKLYKKGV